MKGKIVLIPFPPPHLTATNLRPALVLHEGDRDVVLAFISSKIHVGAGPAGIMVTTSHVGFSRSGLKVDSVIRAKVGLSDLHSPTAPLILQGDPLQTISVCVHRLPSQPP